MFLSKHIIIHSLSRKSQTRFICEFQRKIFRSSNQNILQINLLEKDTFQILYLKIKKSSDVYWHNYCWNVLTLEGHSLFQTLFSLYN